MDPSAQPHEGKGRATIRVARIEARSPSRASRAEIQRALCGEPPLARIIWELPGPHETCWLVQVPEHLALTQVRRFGRLRIDACLVGYRNVDEEPFKFSPRSSR
jgi:hypothetical protein